MQFNDEPDFLTNADESAAQLDKTRRDFVELVAVLADHVQANWTATDLVDLCASRRLLSTDFGEGTSRSLVTKLGTPAGRYIDEKFELDDGRHVVFRAKHVQRLIFLDSFPKHNSEIGPQAIELRGTWPGSD